MYYYIYGIDFNQNNEIKGDESMGLRIYNVLKQKKEEFKPLCGNEVKMYACGITVSGKAHFGHARQALTYDVFRNYLKHKGYDVKYVRNYTDVDDKIILKAKELNMDPMKFAQENLDSIEKDLHDLGIAQATEQPRASEVMNEIIEFCEDLINKGYAYSTETGDVYFSVTSFDEYGKLSHRNIDECYVGVRKSVAEGKRDDRDFALWKGAKEGEIFWKAPWGDGRPGWHIECSAMALKCLGETIDIHGGGKDLIFPHHENEIAQSEARTGKQFANVWTHCGLITVNGQKMSKSLNNGISVRELLDEYHQESIKFMILQNNYKAAMDIVDGQMDQSERQLYKFYKTLNSIENLQCEDGEVKDKFSIEKIQKDFEAAMDDDFNTALAISNLYSLFTDLAKRISKKKNWVFAKAAAEKIKEVYGIIGFFRTPSAEFIESVEKKYRERLEISEEEISTNIEKRNELKKERNYEEADKIRDFLEAQGVELKDSPEGTTWNVRI